MKTEQTAGAIWASKVLEGAEVTIRSWVDQWVEYEVTKVSLEHDGQMGYCGGTDEEEFVEYFAPKVESDK